MNSIILIVVIASLLVIIALQLITNLKLRKRLKQTSSELKFFENATFSIWDEVLLKMGVTVAESHKVLLNGQVEINTTSPVVDETPQLDTLYSFGGGFYFFQEDGLLVRVATSASSSVKRFGFVAKLIQDKKDLQDRLDTIEAAVTPSHATTPPPPNTSQQQSFF